MTQTARVYGGSLYDLAAEEQITETMKDQLSVIRQLFRENPDYVRLLSEPSIPAKDRLGLIDEAFGSSAEHYVINFMKLLCEKGLMREFGGCCDEFIRRYNADNGIAEAVVVSAVPLSESQKDALTKKLCEISGKQIELNLRTDPSILGGMRVEIDGKLLDGTVKGRLTGISRKIEEINL